MKFDITGVILAGGQNKRFPILKGFIRCGRQSILDRTILIFKECFNEVLISTNAPEVYFKKGINLVGDVTESCGPLAGILTGLINATNEYIFIAASDMPFISIELVKHIASSIETGVGAVVATYNGKPEPLLALYNKKIIPTIYREIAAGRRSVREFLNMIDVKYVNESEVLKIDKEGVSFININTVDELKRVNMKCGGEALSI
ncbi:MAG: molybdenum cofactor guanylyltransferase [Candidatus Magnetoovum sp. WYHC-5]|nr:molybdenum cofactor guanylyltransferase [Candidatus Magnetoovum sp. WYHC-5]